MKRLLISFVLNLCLAIGSMTAWSQNLVLEQEEPEDEIAVVGYFCKNDTMTYRQTHNKYKIHEGDTTVSESYVEGQCTVRTILRPEELNLFFYHHKSVHDGKDRVF